MVFGIFVTTLANKSMVFNVELSTTVETLKKALGQREGLKVDEIRLLWAGKEMKNHLTMLEYGIQKNSTLFLVLQLDGGGRKKRIKLVRVLEDGTTVTRQLTGVKLSPEPCMITFEAEPEDPVRACDNPRGFDCPGEVAR